MITASILINCFASGAIGLCFRIQDGHRSLHTSYILDIVSAYEVERFLDFPKMARNGLNDPRWPYDPQKGLIWIAKKILFLTFQSKKRL